MVMNLFSQNELKKKLVAFHFDFSFMYLKIGFRFVFVPSVARTEAVVQPLLFENP